VEHVHINQGAQAVIGNIHPQDSGRAQMRKMHLRSDRDEGDVSANE
jgi:hypothetical protein